MFKEEILGLLGAIITFALAYYGYREQVEFLQFFSSFLAGAFTTYVVQHRLQIESEKRKTKRGDAITMRDKVYGPIFREMSKVLEGLELVERPEWEITSELEEMKTEYLFYNMRRDLKNKFYTLVERLDKYQTIYSATQTLLLRKMKEVVKKSYKMDISVSLGQVYLHLEKVKDAIIVGSITLEQAIMQRVHPNDFIKAKKKVWGEDIFIEVSIKRQKKNIGDFESLYATVLKEMETEPLFREEEKQRQALVKELEIFLDQIKAFITVP